MPRSISDKPLTTVVWGCIERRARTVRIFGPARVMGAHQCARHDPLAGLGHPVEHTSLGGGGVDGLVFCAVNQISDAVRVPCPRRPNSPPVSWGLCV